MLQLTEPRASAKLKVVHAYVAAADPVDGRSGMGVVFVDSQGHVVKRIGRALPGVHAHELAVFRGILYALWNSRRFGVRHVVVHSDAPAVVQQVNGERDVAGPLVGPYLEVRALLHAYREARVLADESAWGREAAAIAAVALQHNTDDVVEDDLPLWSDESAEPSPL
ncbi:MAG TPA: reverse transcriptase-like protein [bacterium]|nr:reverse transcriptase-like protein [bacterium]